MRFALVFLTIASLALAADTTPPPADPHKPAAVWGLVPPHLRGGHSHAADATPHIVYVVYTPGLLFIVVLGVLSCIVGHHGRRLRRLHSLIDQHSSPPQPPRGIVIVPDSPTTSTKSDESQRQRTYE